MNIFLIFRIYRKLIYNFFVLILCNSLFSFKTLSEATTVGQQHFRSSILNSEVSKQIHDQQETSLCWAFALATMLRSSLKVFLKSRMQSSITGLKCVDSNRFHKRLRREIIMMSIPKPLIIKYKMIEHPNKEDFQDEIIDKQRQNLKLAVYRVSLFTLDLILFHRNSYLETHYKFHEFKLAHPSVIDPPGIDLLKSIEEIFRHNGFLEKRPHFQVYEINTVASLKHHFTKNQPMILTGICPAIIAYNQFSSYDPIAHAMVATGINTKNVNNKQEDFVQCKNSYRDDPSQPG